VSKQTPVIILLEHREEYKAIYGMNLTLYLGAEVLVANTIKVAMELVKNSDPVLLFVNNDAYSQDMGADLWQLFDSKRIKVPLFILGSAKVPLDEVTVFDSNIQLRDVLSSMARQMKITANMMAEVEHPEFFPLPTKFVIPGWQTTINIYISKNEQFEVFFQPDDVITGDELDQLDRDLNFQLYVKSDERLKFVNSLTGQISAKLNDPNLSNEDRINLTATGYQMVMEQARKIGIGQGTMELADSCIQSISTIVDDNPQINDLLNFLLTDSTSLRYKHSLLINYIGCHIIKKTNWGSREMQETFSFISFFQNIALSKDEHVLITTNEELENSGLPEEEKKLIENHALIAAKLVSSIDKIPFGQAATVIKQHHGSNKGIGLSSLSLSINPLSIVFLFAEEWANLVLKFSNENKRPTKKEIIRMLHKKYNKPGFNKILPILHTLDF